MLTFLIVVAMLFGLAALLHRADKKLAAKEDAAFAKAKAEAIELIEAAKKKL